MIELYPHQKEALDNTAGMNRVAYYHDMGLGKTFTGAEKLMRLGARVNLVVCQKSKVSGKDSWIEHFEQFYFGLFFDLTNKNDFIEFLDYVDSDDTDETLVGVINYDLVFRRKELSQLRDFTLMLDESSLIQNENAKRSKFILKRMNPANVILLSGTPTNGKYENLWSQLHLLGWNITKDLYWRHYIDYEYVDNGSGFPVKLVHGYKNVDRLKMKMREYGCQFLKTDDVFSLPEQNFMNVSVATPKAYDRFLRNGIVTVDGKELVGDSVLTKALYARMICGHYSQEKMEALKDILQSTEDRVVVFYNFNEELNRIVDMCAELGKPVSVVNGKGKDLKRYEECGNAITLVQYQAGAMGGNYQKANKMIYFTLPWGLGSCNIWDQAKKRIHRIGQNRPCFYYTLLCKGTIEETNLLALQEGKELTDELFKEK